jgi:DNA-binding MarR family transcriptional regulator
MTNSDSSSLKPEQQCHNLNLRKAMRVMNRVYDSHLQPEGINVGQFSLLRAVALLGQTTNKELQSVLSMEQTTLTRNLKPLMRDLYIQVSPGIDRRQRLLSLTPLGQTKYSDASLLWQQAQIHIEQQLGETQSAQILKLSSAILKAWQ